MSRKNVLISLVVVIIAAAVVAANLYYRRDKGLVVSLITGRMVSSALRFARELDLVAPVIGYQGALIREMPEASSTRPGRLLVHTPLRAEIAREVVIWGTTSSTPSVTRSPRSCAPPSRRCRRRSLRWPGRISPDEPT